MRKRLSRCAHPMWFRNRVEDADDRRTAEMRHVAAVQGRPIPPAVLSNPNRPPTPIDVTFIYPRAVVPLVEILIGAADVKEEI